MTKCDKKCSNCSQEEEVQELTLEEAVHHAKMQLIAERIAAKEDFDILTKVIRDQYIELRVAPYKAQYTELLKIFEDSRIDGEKNEPEVPKLPLIDYN